MSNALDATVASLLEDQKMLKAQTKSMNFVIAKLLSKSKNSSISAGASRQKKFPTTSPGIFSALMKRSEVVSCPEGERDQRHCKFPGVKHLTMDSCSDLVQRVLPPAKNLIVPFLFWRPRGATLLLLFGQYQEGFRCLKGFFAKIF